MILVDPLRRVASRSGWPYEQAAHLVSDTSIDELHRFARSIGLRARWFQGDHYDLTARRHAMALAAGAVEVGPRELARRRVRADGKVKA